MTNDLQLGHHVILDTTARRIHIQPECGSVMIEVLYRTFLHWFCTDRDLVRLPFPMFLDRGAGQVDGYRLVNGWSFHPASLPRVVDRHLIVTT